MKVHLVDGTYELFRAFFAVPSSKNSADREVGACRGLVRTLLTLLGQADVTHVACAFDHVIESFRNELYAGYKTGVGLDPNLLSQFPLAEDVTRALGIVTWPMIEFEADDAIATAAARFAQDPRVEQVVICSPDKDMSQCVVAGKIVCWDRMRNNWLDEAGVHAKFGVGPNAIADYLALVGDSADGIPGVPRWGAKSASQLLAKHGSIEAIPSDPAAWGVTVRGAAALAASLNENRPQAALYKTLATLRTDVPLQESLEDLEWRGADRKALEALCQEIDDRFAIERVTRYRSDSPG